MARLYEVRFVPGPESAEEASPEYALVRVWTDAPDAEADARREARKAMNEEAYEDWEMRWSKLIEVNAGPAPEEFLTIEWKGSRL